MHYKRGYSRRQVRDTLATPHRWRGNAADRFDHATRTALLDDDSSPGSSPPAKRSRVRKRFVLQAKLLPSACLPGMSFLLRRFNDWATFSRYATQRAADQALVAAMRERGRYLHFRVREVG